MIIARSPGVLLLLAMATSGSVADDKVDPAKIQDKVTIEPGKTLFVQFQVDGNALKQPKKVEKAETQAPHPVLRVAQDGRQPVPHDPETRSRRT